MQFALIISGTIATVVALKFSGYNGQNPSPFVQWHPWSLFVRNWGWLFLVVPISWWLFSSWRASRRGEGHDLSGPAILFGMAMVLGFLMFYLFTASNCAIYSGPIQAI